MESISGLTVGVPVCNEEVYIEQTLRSIVETVGPGVPIVVSDNHSTDSTREIVRSFAEAHPSVRLVSNRDDRAASNFMNCLRHADSEYFCWISGHDLMCGDFWGQAVRHLDENPSVVWVYGSCGLIDAEGRPLDAESASDSDVDSVGISDEAILRKLLGVCSGMFVHGVFRRSVMVDCAYAGGWAGDRCMIAYACFRGDVRWLKSKGIVRRLQRSADGGETLEQRNERYRKWGFLEYEDAAIDPNHYMRLKLLRIYLGERLGRVGIREVRSAMEVLFRPGAWRRDLSLLLELRKLRSVESFFPRSGSFLSLD